MKPTEFLESIEDFQVSFGGKKSIDAELFTKSIDDTVTLVKASADAIDPSCFIKLEIKANKEGSFQTVIDIITKYSPDLLAVSSIAGNVIQGFLNFILIKQHLKGKKAKKIETKDDEMAIQNQKDEILKVSKKIGQTYFKDNRIDNLVVNITNNISNGDRDYLSVKTKDREVKIDKSEYENMATSVIDGNPVAKTITNKPIDVDLPLKKPDLLGKSKWEFIYNKKIEAKIDDEDFLAKVRKGEIKNLYAGVRIPCKLQFEYDLDENHDIVPNSDKYTILEITGDIIESEEDNQISLFDNNS